MKKILTILIATLLIGTTAFAQESEITVEKGQYLEVGSADRVDIYNKANCVVWKDVEITDGKVFIPLNNPLQLIYVHIYTSDEENVLKVHLTEPHEHQGHYVDAVRPTDKKVGNKAYFYCDCGKYFEDKACTIEITEPIDKWAYLAPIPKEEWDGPVPYVEEIDGKNITDPTKPNPSWEQEKVEEYYEQEEIEIQKELEERKTKSKLVVESNEDNETIESELVVESIETNEAIEPITFAIEPVKVEKELTFWERIKKFFINLFN